jgi:hypothetical protein
MRQLTLLFVTGCGVWSIAARCGVSPTERCPDRLAHYIDIEGTLGLLSRMLAGPIENRPSDIH